MIRWHWWHAPDDIIRGWYLDTLRAHNCECIQCLRHNANPTGVVQANPDLTPSEILSGELDNTRHPAPATLPERSNEMESA